MAQKLPSDDIQKLLKTVCDQFDKEDTDVRERNVRQWKRLKYTWAGFQRLWWSETAHDWRVYDDETDSAQSYQSSYYDKPINIFRAYLESIIAALSVNVPPVRCIPDDADDPLDISTAKAGDNIAKLVYRHNDVTLKWVYGLFIYCTEGTVFAHTYSKSDKEYGTYKKEKYEDVEEEIDSLICPVCQTNLTDANLSDQVMNQFNPGDETVPQQDILVNENKYLCPQCLELVDPLTGKQKIVVNRMVGFTDEPKSRQCIDIYGGLFVKIPSYAKTQRDMPYLRFSYETHYSNVLERFEHLYKDRSRLQSGMVPDTYEKQARLSIQYNETLPEDMVTISTYWLRPSAFNVLEEESAKELKKLYPDGVKVTFAGDLFGEACDEQLDDHWTITINPLADYLQSDPLGLLLVPVQEITSDLISLVLQTIEHGIPQTFVDPNIINIEQYQQLEVAPGMIIPTKPGGGKKIGDGFYQISTAILSGEVLPFAQQVQEMGQLVSGALPSLFGGSQESGSKTAAQYAMSRAQALQRLQTVWKMFTIWWKTIFGKVIPAYIEDMIEDERYVEMDKDGNYINTFIRLAELEGKIGNIELEADEQLPITWQQEKDVIMQLMSSANPQILAALMSPENMPIIARSIGITEFVIPGEDDRQKQYEEIKLLTTSMPIDDGMQELPSVEPEPLVDNHLIHIEICKKYLVSEQGRLAKVQNPDGYKNVLLHMQLHIMAMQMMAPPAQSMPNEPNKEQNNAGPEPEPVV